MRSEGFSVISWVCALLRWIHAQTLVSAALTLGPMFRTSVLYAHWFLKFCLMVVQCVSTLTISLWMYTCDRVSEIALRLKLTHDESGTGQSNTWPSWRWVPYFCSLSGSWVVDSSNTFVSQMPRVRQPCARFTLKCAFTSILAFVFFTIILTFALFGRQRNDITSSMEQNVAKDMARKVWRGVGIDQSQETYGGKRRVRYMEEPEVIRSGWKRARGGYKSRSNEESARTWERPEVNEDDKIQARQVVNLLKMESHNHSNTPEPVSTKVLMSYVQLLRDVMISRSSMLTQPSVKPSCVGDLMEGEVEDILCIPKPNYLKHIKNPCWYEYSLNISSQPKLHCLPYFHILGCAKSGTTDLWNRLLSHPHIVANYGALHKEGLWWSWHRYGVSGYKRMQPVNFRSYVDIFRNVARQIHSSLDEGNDYHKKLITGDGSPPDFWDFRGWPNITQNRGLEWPRVITPHLMKHFYDDPKFILMFRDPIDRLYSDYFFIGSGLTSQDFHQDLIRSITLLAECVKQRSVQGCFYNHNLYKQMPVRLPFACYSVFMREWLQQFSLDSFLFIKTEEYETNPEDTLKDVIKFLGLRHLRQTKIQEIVEEERARVTFQRKIAGPMKPETKAILTNMLQPCSHLLARMIQQPRFVWDT